MCKLKQFSDMTNLFLEKSEYCYCPSEVNDVYSNDDDYRSICELIVVDVAAVEIGA